MRKKNEKISNNSSVSPPHMEPTIGNGSLAKKAGKGCDKRCRIHVRSKRRRLADPDGVSIKAAIDGLVVAKILPDDRAEFVKEVSFSQERAESDETIIEVIWD